MDAVTKLDELGRPAWITLMVLGFIVFWPVGLMVLGYMLWSGRMGCTHNGRMPGGGWGRWRERNSERGSDRALAAGAWQGRGSAFRPSGNRAFDEYREEALKRLYDEQKEFREFLDRLRHAKDKVEFDQFMAQRGDQRRPGSDTPGGPVAPQPQG